MSRTTSPKQEPPNITPENPADPRKDAQARTESSSAENSQASEGRAAGNESSTPPGSRDDANQDMLAGAWSQLKRQQTEFERRSEQLGSLRNRLQTYLEKQNQLLRERHQDGDNSLASASEATQDYFSQVEQRRDTRSNALRSAGADLAQTDYSPGAEQAEELEQRALTDRGEIDQLGQDKRKLQERLETLQRQAEKLARGGAATTGAIGSRARNLCVLASIAVGLLVSAILVPSTHFSYQVSLSVRAADPSQLSSAQLVEHRNALVAALAASKLEPGSRIDRILPADQLTDTPSSFKLRAVVEEKTATSRREAKQQLQRVADLYLDQIETARLRSIAEAKSAISALDDDITLALAEHANVVEKMGDHRLLISVENPKTELARLQSDLAANRKEFSIVQDKIRRAQDQIRNLRQVQIPELPEVDGQAREQEESKHNILKQDLEELRFRLEQLRDHLLAAFEDAGDALRRCVSACKSLINFIDTQRPNLNNRKVIAALIDVRGKAGDLNQVIFDFEKGWQRNLLNLHQLEVDPRRRECLKTQRFLANMVKDFRDDSDDLMEALSLEYQLNLVASIENRPEYFGLRNDLVQEIVTFQQRQLALHRALEKFIPEDNNRLKGIMSPIVGITAKVSAQQGEIQKNLSLMKRQAMEQEMASSILETQSRLDKLLEQRDKIMTQVFDTQDDLDSLLPYIAAHGATETVIRYTPEKADKLAAQAQRLKSEKQRSLAHLTSLKRAGQPLRLGRPQVADWPDNIVARASQIGFGGMSATLITYLVLSLGLVLVRRIARMVR